MTSFDATVTSLARPAGSVRSDAKAPASTLSRRYVGPPGRQTHLLEAGLISSEPSLWCLHATAYAGRSFAPLIEALAGRRRVVAPDTMGYGGSDKPGQRIEIGDYASLIDQALDAAGEDRVDLLGYHTGALVAAELARLRPDRVRRLILIGVPLPRRSRTTGLARPPGDADAAQRPSGAVSRAVGFPGRPARSPASA